MTAPRLEPVQVMRGSSGPFPGVRLGDVVAYEFELGESLVPRPGTTRLERVFVLLDVGVQLSNPPYWQGRDAAGRDRAPGGAPGAAGGQAREVTAHRGRANRQEPLGPERSLATFVDARAASAPSSRTTSTSRSRSSAVVRQLLIAGRSATRPP
jgi:hypothetical protein